MHLPRYPIAVDESGFKYQFESTGPNGKIAKVVLFTPLDDTGVFNLGFGDEVGDAEEIDDMAVTNNGDTDRILSTVAAIAADFLNRYPDAALFMTGSTPARTRLYQMRIGRNIGWISERYIVLGKLADIWKPFERRHNFSGFYIAPKSGLPKTI